MPRTRAAQLYLACLLAAGFCCRAAGADAVPRHSAALVSRSITGNRLDSTQPWYPRETVEGRALTRPNTVVTPGMAAPAAWKLTLADARRIAFSNNKDIAYVRYLPIEAVALIDSEEAVFDTVLEFGGTWNKYDRQMANEVESLGSISATTVNDKYGGSTLSHRQRVLMDLRLADVWQLERVPVNFAFYVRGQGHSFQYDTRELVYAWIDKHLQTPRAATPQPLKKN